MTDLFEIASRNKVTIPTGTVGEIHYDQLWDLPLKTGKLNLNSIAVSLKNKISKTEDLIDLVDGDSTNSSARRSADLDKLRFDIVMHVISVLKSERDTKVAHESLNSQLRVLDEAIAKQEQEELLTGSKEDLLAKRAAIIAAAKL